MLSLPPLHSSSLQLQWISSLVSLLTQDLCTYWSFCLNALYSGNHMTPTLSPLLIYSLLIEIFSDYSVYNYSPKHSFCSLPFFPLLLSSSDIMCTVNTSFLLISLPLKNANSIVFDYFIHCYIPRASDSGSHIVGGKQILIE